MTGILYRGCAVVDHATRSLAPDMAVLVADGRVGWLGPAEEAPDPGPGVELVDAGGTTAVAGMVDAHSHLTLPGGAHWIDRAADPTDRLLAAAEENARLLRQAGVRWARDVGAPVRDGRALSLTVRDRWLGRPGYPYVRAAGCWLARSGSLPSQLPVEVEDGDGLLAAALGQLDDGADLVKLYMDGPDRDTSPFTADEVHRTVEAAHARGARVTAHSTLLPGARAAVAAGIDAVEHGFRLDADLARAMAAQGTALVSTLAVMESWASFGRTTRLPRFASAEGRAGLAERREAAHESVRLAAAAGVPIAAGTDLGGGSLRANQLAWEVETLVAAGLDPYDALAAATVNGGRLLGEPGAGVLEAGRPGRLRAGPRRPAVRARVAVAGVAHELVTRTGRERFSGWIAGLGTDSGHRVVIGHWHTSPYGVVTDAMVEDPAGHRTLYAPTPVLAEYLAAAYRFDEVQVAPCGAWRSGPGWTVRAGPLRLAFTVGRRGPLGWLLRAVPAALASTTWWVGLVDLPAGRVLPGVRTRGRTRDGRRQWYGAHDLHPIVAAEAALGGRALGALRAVHPPVGFGFGSVPGRPSLVHLTTIIEGVRPGAGDPG